MQRGYDVNEGRKRGTEEVQGGDYGEAVGEGESCYCTASNVHTNAEGAGV